jgi:hypothetical protein
MNQNPQTKLQLLTTVSKSFLYLIKNGSKPLATYKFAYTSCEGIESKQNEIHTNTIIHKCLHILAGKVTEWHIGIPTLQGAPRSKLPSS